MVVGSIPGLGSFCASRSSAVFSHFKNLYVRLIRDSWDGLQQSPVTQAHEQTGTENSE